MPVLQCFTLDLCYVYPLIRQSSPILVGDRIAESAGIKDRCETLYVNSFDMEKHIGLLSTAYLYMIIYSQTYTYVNVLYI